MSSTRSENRLPFQIILLILFFVWLVPVTPAQEESPTPSPDASSTPAVAKQSDEPAYTNYRGVFIGMSVGDAREKLGRPKSKGKRQDFFVFSKTETAQVFYLNGKVSAVSIDYLSADSGAPTPSEVFGFEVTPKKNGSVYKMVRYTKAGYWIAYNRTASKSPTISITMRKLR